MNYLFFILHLALATWMILHFKWMQVPGIKPKWLAAYFALKCFMGMILGYIYLHYYGFGDTLRYVKDADLLFQIGKENPMNFFHIMTGFGGDPKILDVYRHQLDLWYDSGFDSYYNDNRTIIRVNALIRLVSFGYYEVHVIWMNVLAFLGLSWLYKTFYYGTNFSSKTYSDQSVFSPTWLFVAPFFLPTVLVWGSGVLKEPMLLFVLGALFRSFQLALKRKEKSDILLLLTVIFIFFFIKSYLLLILLPGLIALYWVETSQSKRPLLLFILSYCIFLLVILVAGEFYPQASLPMLLYGKQLNMWRFAVFSHAGSLVDPIMLAPTIASFLKRLPEAICFSMFRPFPWELNQWWMIPMALENLVFPVIVFVVLYQGRLKSITKSPFALLAVFAALGLFALVGFTTPVLGSLVRYKMPAILLLMLAFCCGSQISRIKKPE